MGFLTHPHPTYQKGLPHPSLTWGKHIMVILALGTQKAPPWSKLMRQQSL